MKKNIKFKIKQGAEKIISSGGFVFVDRLLEQHGITQEMDNELPKDTAQQQYPYSDSLRSLLFTRLAGGESLEGVNHFRQELQEIRRVKVPSVDIIARSLKKLSLENGIFCDAKQNTVVETIFHEKLNHLLFSTAARSLPQKTGGYTLDIDAHYIPCENQDAHYN